MNRLKIFLFLGSMMLIVAGCSKNEPVPSASFEYSGNNQFKVPCTIIFKNQSSNAFSYLWKFGDDSTSTISNPTHQYTRPGKYEIYLRAYTESEHEWASVIKTITVKDTIK
ncbi:MAG: PKD domain-containing protein [Bacteroidales bacterium]|nr:PKD domain-containing protein [Bacteroidales bacterium]